MVSLIHSRLDYGNFLFVGLPVYLQRRLHSTVRTQCRSSFDIPISSLRPRVWRTRDTIHWLRLPERVNFKLALMAYRVLNGMSSSYLNKLVSVSSMPGRRRLRSSLTLQLHVPLYRLSTADHRLFPVAASIFWNTLPVCQMMCSLQRLFQTESCFTSHFLTLPIV